MYVAAAAAVVVVVVDFLVIVLWPVVMTMTELWFEMTVVAVDGR